MTLPPGPRGPAPYLTARFAHRPLDMLDRWHRRYESLLVLDGAEHLRHRRLRCACVPSSTPPSGR